MNKYIAILLVGIGLVLATGIATQSEVYAGVSKSKKDPQKDVVTTEVKKDGSSPNCEIHCIIIQTKPFPGLILDRIKRFCTSQNTFSTLSLSIAVVT